MNVSPAWISSVNYWLRRLKVMDGGGFKLPGASGSLIPQLLAWFELKTDLAPNGTCDAYFVVSKDGQPYATDQARGTTKIKDLLGFAGTGRDTVNPTNTGAGPDGDFCLAIHDDYLGSNVQADDIWLVACMVPQQWSYHEDANATQIASLGGTELTHPAATIPADGKYLVEWQIAAQNTSPGAGPAVCQLLAALCLNHSVGIEQQQGHYHCPQSPTPAGTGPAWKITVGVVDYNLPQIVNPTGTAYASNTSWSGTLDLHAGDVLTLSVTPLDCAAEIQHAVLTVVYLG